MVTTFQQILVVSFSLNEVLSLTALCFAEKGERRGCGLIGHILSFPILSVGKGEVGFELGGILPASSSPTISVELSLNFGFKFLPALIQNHCFYVINYEFFSFFNTLV